MQIRELVPVAVEFLAQGHPRMGLRAQALWFDSFKVGLCCFIIAIGCCGVSYVT